MRQPADKPQDHNGTRGRRSIVLGRMVGGQVMMTRLTGAILRAALVVLLIALPSLMLPGTGNDTTQMVALIALIAAIFTMVEYLASYPSLVEFRDAGPFNRIRFAALLLSVFVLSVILRGWDSPTTLTLLLTTIGDRIAGSLDFPYSPVRLMVLMLPQGASDDLIGSVRMAAGITYLISLMSLAWFIIHMRLTGWPVRREGFNVWVNLPTFDPTSGGDVVARLNRDSQINLILGFLLPFMVPAVVKLASDIFDPISLGDPHTLIWTMTAWAFLPASLLMRGVALGRVAQMISAQRRRTYAAGAAQHA
jgi:hypothetical protein